ncbi:carboxylesterase family protein [Flavivirga eckloniae]|uniref:Peptidase S9 prolyl oligopeptidase catalytic domain-containing protein n=1 Tax=Flavivirga eckloniae TaxID=1803846 RepID=A0A2K9PP13_9FLAO|nr:MopE-related protein [Flavivirga eckloniae]AUP78776.1 hypothetical protein C1H87_08715 [Flavivirga eckloniae]
MNNKFKYIALLILLFSVLIYSCSSNDESCVKKTWYIDADNDNYGSNSNSIQSCEKPDGYVDNNLDCDDDNDQVNPDIQEKHNGIDDNCNGVIDECSSNSECNGICVDGVCVEDDTSFSYEFTKYHFNHELTNTDISYNFFAPKQALGSPSEKFPLIIGLHGFEYFARSKNDFLTGEASEQIGYYALGWIEEENQQQYPAYVLAPHIDTELFQSFNGEYPSWTDSKSVDFIDKLLDYIITNNPNIDKNRVYLTGHSMGGAGTWYIGSELKDKIAAIVPLSPAIKSDEYDILESRINNGEFNNLPVWCFIHRTDANNGSEDSRKLFQTMEQNSLSPVYTKWVESTNYNLSDTQIENEINMSKRFFYTEYDYSCSPGICHFAMTVALREPLLFKWLFQQRKNEQ